MSSSARTAIVDPALRSWVPGSDGGDFPIQNLPYGVFRDAHRAAGPGIAIGDFVFDLRAAAHEGLVEDGGLPPGIFDRATLNALLSLGPAAWSGLRRRVTQLLSGADRTIRDAPGLTERLLVPRSEATMQMPVEVGDFVDFNSSLEHAINMGRLLRPGADPLPKAWRYLPMGYHGRAGSVVVGGTPVTRPRGQLGRADGPAWGPTGALDFELEVGFVTGSGNRHGVPIAAAEADDHIFGLVLVNDWSARDIQAWEYVPLGPFLGKSFATSISPWIVPLDAVRPHRVPGPAQEPPVLDYLATTDELSFDIDLEVGLRCGDMDAPDVIARTNFRNVYWNIAQQLAHATSNGAPARPGDLFASGTISGSAPGSYGSLMEHTHGGARPLELSSGATRTWLEDGDVVSMRGTCGGDPAGPAIGFGTLENSIEPAPAL